jgi:hypothetical protein
MRELLLKLVTQGIVVWIMAVAVVYVAIRAVLGA